MLAVLQARPNLPPDMPTIYSPVKRELVPAPVVKEATRVLDARATPAECTGFNAGDPTLCPGTGGPATCCLEW